MGGGTLKSSRERVQFWIIELSTGSPEPACLTETTSVLLEGIGSIETAVFHTDISPKQAFAFARGLLILGKAEHRV